MVAPWGLHNNLCMARTVKKPKEPGHFLREWRKFHKLSLDQVTERVREIAAERYPSAAGRRSFKKLGATHGNLSRIERGEVPYNQTLLEILAVVYKSDAGSLIERSPKDPAGIQTTWDQIPTERRSLAADVLRSFIRKTE